MDNPSDSEDIDKRFETLRQKAGEFLDSCRFGSAYRLYGEIRRLAKSERQALHYILSLFHQMDLALDLQEPARTREMAIELIALLESEDRARQIQPDLPEPSYEHITGWMTACAYENLAEATGRMDGYNSEGMHACITDGIQVCRRTGKLACIRCFREYATEVYTAADDLPMALHHARSIATHPGPWSNRGNRRWLGSRNEAWLYLLAGQVKMASEALERAVNQAQEEEVALPLQARLRTAVEMEQLRLLTGEQDATAIRGDEGELVSNYRKERLPEEEYPTNHLRWVLNDALAACCRKEPELAIHLLQEQDRAVLDHRNLHEWFEVRLRLIAAHRLAGQEDRVGPLAKQLDHRARKARDWLTLRRLEQLLNPAEPPSPIASIQPLTSGLFAPPAATTSVPAAPLAPAEAPASENAGPAEPPPPPPTPLDERIAEFRQRLDQAQDDSARQALLNDILAIPQEQLKELVDAGRLVQMLTYLTGDGSRAEEIWNWAQKTAQPHWQSAPMLSFLALLGDILRTSPQTPKELISVEQIEKLFRRSLELDPDNAGNFARAGAFYLDIENLGEAERCLARGFRLQRDNSFLALRLADVYKETERPRDALAVLDMCLRHGCEDPTIAWDAALTAMTVKQHDAQLTYLDRFEELAPNQPWTGYYKALAHLDLGQPQEALADLDIEALRSPERPLGVLALRACAVAALDKKETFAEMLREILNIQLQTIDYLTLAGVYNLFQRLWTASQCLPGDDPLRKLLDQRLLMMGMAPDDMIDQERRGELVSNVYFYRCIVEQPLDENWPEFPGCLAGQQEWKKYITLWGVLARDEEEAGQIALQWQARCYPLPASISEIQRQDDTYQDRVGAVWQGERYGVVEQEAELG